MLWLSTWCFGGTPNCKSGYTYDSFTCSWNSFPHVRWSCPSAVWLLLLCLIVVCFIVCGCCLLDLCSFLMWAGERVDLGKRGGGGTLEGVEVRGIVVRKYCMREFILIKYKKSWNFQVTKWIELEKNHPKWVSLDHKNKYCMYSLMCRRYLLVIQYLCYNPQNHRG